MSVIFVGAPTSKLLEEMDRVTNDWFEKAARMECGWICPSCCTSFSDGMPDDCPHGVQSCSDLNKRDKAAASRIKAF